MIVKSVIQIKEKLMNCNSLQGERKELWTKITNKNTDDKDGEDKLVEAKERL